MVKKSISLILLAFRLIPSTAIFAQSSTQSVTIQRGWGNPVSHIVDGWTEFFSGECVVPLVD